MEVFRFTQNVWGQEMLVGMSWDLLWLPVAAGATFIVIHQLVRRLARKS